MDPINPPAGRSQITHPFGLLVLGHGTYSREGIAEFKQTVNAVAEFLPDVPTTFGFLQYAQPDLPRAIDHLASKHVRDMIVVPLFLFAASHIKQDIPEALEQAVSRHRGRRAWLVPPLADHPAILRLSLRRCRETLAATGRPASDHLLVLVGRGGQDRQANAEFCRFADTRRQVAVGGSHVADVIPALLAGPDRPWAEAVTESRKQPFRGVIVQPHLLFSGRLTQLLNTLVQEQESSGSGQAWWVTEPLGRHAALAPLVVERFEWGCQRALGTVHASSQDRPQEPRRYPLAT
jgi:sirohydrochlorin cobaltochelatase